MHHALGVRHGAVSEACGAQVTLRIDGFALDATVAARLFRHGSVALALPDATSAVDDVRVRTSLGDHMFQVWRLT